MAEKAFLDPATRVRAGQAVKDVEAQTAAEVVIAVQPTSSAYHQVSYLFGFALAVAGLVALLFVDIEYPEWFVLLEVVALFAIGSLGCEHSSWLRRLLIPERSQVEQVQRAARAAFVELGISKTHHRTGILVFASLLERRVVLVPDVGIDEKALGAGWLAARTALETSLRPLPNADRLLAAVRGLAPALAQALPHVEGQLNELPDEPEAA